MTRVIRCLCSRCNGALFLRLSDLIAAHPEVVDARWGDADIEVDDDSVSRHPSSQP